MHTKMNRLKSMILTLLCFLVMLTMLSAYDLPVYGDDGKNSTDVTYYDGTYEGVGTGFNGDIKVNVTITDGTIANVEVTKQSETESHWEKALALLDVIVEKKTADVDGISGATKSSDGIKAAVNDALKKAKVDPNGWYDSGEGTEKNPYVIKTADQLSKFAVVVDDGESFEGQYVALGADIDLSGIENWNPIGTEGASKDANKFAGTFDGKGFTINGMTIVADDFTTETNVGLFSSMDNTTTIKNLHMSDVHIDIKGSDVLRAGSIAGDAISGNGGTASAWIDRSSAIGIINVEVSGPKLAFGGGLLGRTMNWTRTTNSWTDVDITVYSRGGSNSAYAGGVVGNTGNNSLLLNLASFGEMRGISPKSTGYGGHAGGISTMIAGKAWNIYATGSATAGNAGSQQSVVGTLASQVTTSGMIGNPNYVYPDTGALRNYLYYPNDAALKIEKYNNAGTELLEENQVDPRATGIVSVNYDKIFETNALAMNRADMAEESFAETLNANLKEVRKLLDAYGYTDVNLYNWEVADGKVLPVGNKWVSKDPDASIFAGGTGTAEDPYQIETEVQLRKFAGSLTEGIDYSNSYVKVMNDIDVSSADWSPIGGQDYAFNGTFDGGGCNISGMKAGTEEAPYEMGRDNPYMGFFGVLGKDAVVKDVNLTDVDFYATTPQYVYLGGIAAINDASSETKKAMVIDGCSVKGKMTVVADKSNAMVGGIIAQQYKGAIINCMTDVDLKCTVKTGNAIAEVGGLVALNNRGLVANSYTLGDVWGSASRNDGDEGMASTGNLVGVNAGDLVGCYSKGDNTTAEYSVYAGELTGWITGIGKVYSCYYNKEAKMSIDGRIVNPPADFGTKVAPGVNEEGDAYVGGIVDELVGYTASDYNGIADKLNAKFVSYPIDLSIYGITDAALKQWKYDSVDSIVTFDEEAEKAAVTYKQPQAEIVPPDVEEIRDGIWYGRDDQKKVVVKIVTEAGEVTSTEVVSGDNSDEEAFSAAVSRARTKALYGDATGYGAADTSVFGGGKGTKESPYLITNEQQLRAIAEALNEDETFADVYFKQTADIDVSSADWLPIGHGIMAKVKKAWTQVAAYPFLGNYDGDSFKISGLKIGSTENPSNDPRVNFTAGLFGFVSGDHYSNEKITDDVRISRLENINLRGVDINVTSEGQNYTGGLLGNAQNGFLVDNCSVTGKVSSYSAASFARGAGMAGNVIRGTVLNSWTSVDVNAETDAGNTYAGGLYSIDNRVTSINCYSSGTVTGNAAANNKVHIGGISGQAGGVHYNCYAAGDVTSLKTTSDAGLVEGRLAGIAVDSKVYYNSDAKLTIAGTEREAAAVGVSMPENPDITAKTAAEMASGEFAALLNRNAKAASTDVNSLQDIISSQTDLTHVVQFSGNTNDLSKWISAEGKAILLDKNLIRKADEEEARKKAEEEAAKAAAEAAKARERAAAEEAVKAAAEAKAKTVKTVTVNAATVNATAIDEAVKVAGGSAEYVTKIILGKKVKKISKGAFKSYGKVKTLEIRSKKLKKKSVKGSLKGSKVKTVKVNVGKKKSNKSYVKKYKKIFTKKNVGKKAKVVR